MGYGVELGQRSGGTRPEYLSREAWLAYLDEIVRFGDQGEFRVGGQRLEDRDVRALHRWRREAGQPTMWRADEFLIRYLGAGGVQDFFDFCAGCNRWPWQQAWAPLWER